MTIKETARAAVAAYLGTRRYPESKRSQRKARTLARRAVFSAYEARGNVRSYATRKRYAARVASSLAPGGRGETWETRIARRSAR